LVALHIITVHVVYEAHYFRRGDHGGHEVVTAILRHSQELRNSDHLAGHSLGSHLKSQYERRNRIQVVSSEETSADALNFERCLLIVQYRPKVFLSALNEPPANLPVQFGRGG
jgi:hypothetical protein